MKIIAPLLLILASCAPISPDSIYRTSVEVSIPSAKPPKAFALCAIGALPDGAGLMNAGEHYWFVRTSGGVAFERWDFVPTASGSTAERRSGQIAAGFGTGRVRACA